MEVILIWVRPRNSGQGTIFVELQHVFLTNTVIIPFKTSAPRFLSSLFGVVQVERVYYQALVAKLSLVDEWKFIHCSVFRAALPDLSQAIKCNPLIYSTLAVAPNNHWELDRTGRLVWGQFPKHPWASVFNLILRVFMGKKFPTTQYYSRITI